METVILKIGGSVITEKDKDRLEVRDSEVSRIAKEVASAINRKRIRLVLVHGAGPFGHRLVSDYGIKDGVRDSKGVEGFIRTHDSVQALDKKISDILLSEGLMVFPVQPSACIVQKGKRISEFNISAVMGLLDMGIIPIMYGDMVLDHEQGGSVVSGDAIVSYLARELGASRVLMGTDVDGVYTSDPKSGKADRIENINSKNMDKVIKGAGGSRSLDVTGGMKGKLLEIRDGLEGVNITVFSALINGNMEKALMGEHVGTSIEL